MEYVKKLAVCNAETDTLEISLAAFRNGHISKEQLDDLTAIHPQGCSQVPTVAERRTALLKHIRTNFQGKLDMHSKDPEPEVLALARQALREGLIKQDVIDHLTSLHPQVPIPMRHRYLLMFICLSLTKILDKYWKRALKTVPYELQSASDPLIFAKVAVEDNLIDKNVLDRLSTLYPEAPKFINFNSYFLYYTSLAKELVGKTSLVKPARFLPSSDSFNGIDDIPLSPKHLPQLNELLTSYAHKWRDIGIMLRFEGQDLKNIETSPLLIPTAPKSYLTRLLEEWLQSAQKYTLPPTMGNLRTALNSQSVGLGKLASNFSLQTDECASNRPAYSYVIESSSGDLKPVYADIYLEEGNSTLLEINRSLNSTNEIIWLKNGVKLPAQELFLFPINAEVKLAQERFFYPMHKIKSAQEPFAQQPFLYLKDADIDIDGCKFSCQALASARTAPITVHVSCPLDEFKASLANVYLAQPELPEDTWPPVGSKKFINLALIKQEKVNYGSEYVRQTIRGDMDDILQHKKTIKYEDLYNSLKSRYLEGRPGCGKTTFVHKISQKWADKTSGPMRLLLLVSLRVLNTFTKPNLLDILKLFSDLKVSPELIEQRDGKGVCFIFDGFDEFSPPDGDNSIVYKIIKKTYLSQSIVIVASRPAAVAKLRNRADKVVEVLGFLNDQIFEYFDHYPFSSSTKSAELKAYLTSHPNVLHMCYLPIHAVMVAFLFEVTGSVPRTETQMYEHFTHFTLRRSLSKDQEIEQSDIDVVHSLNEELQQLFQQICHLAFEKTLSSKQVIDQNEVSSFFIVKKHGDISLGLITVDRTAGLYGFKNIYTFQHLTFQEYLAAYHISTLSKEEQMKLIEEHGDKNHMLVVWKFYCGLVEIDEHGIVKLILDKAKKNFHHSILCAYESQQTLACTELLKTFNYNIELADQNLLISDYTAIGYIISNNMSEVPARLSLLDFDMNNEATDALLSEIQHGELELCVQRSTIDALQVACIRQLLSKVSLIELSIDGLESLDFLQATGLSLDFPQVADLKLDFPPAGFNHSIIATLSIPNIPRLLHIGDVSFRNLKFLNLKSSIVDHSEIEALADGLKSGGNLEHLDISSNNIDNEGGILLAEGLKNCKALQRFIINNNKILPFEMIHLLTSIRHNYLKVSDVEIIPQNVHQRLKGKDLMKCLTNLQSLDLTLEIEEIQIFCRNAKSWKMLRELKLSFVLKYDMQAICNCLGYFNKLEKLVLRNGIIDMKSAECLKVCYDTCPNIKVIDIKYNEIGPSEHRFLQENLPRNLNMLVLMSPPGYVKRSRIGL